MDGVRMDGWNDDAIYLLQVKIICLLDHKDVGPLSKVCLELQATVSNFFSWRYSFAPPLCPQQGTLLKLSCGEEAGTQLTKEVMCIDMQMCSNQIKTGQCS